jgi:hypothetical protein
MSMSRFLSVAAAVLVLAFSSLSTGCTSADTAASGSSANGGSGSGGSGGGY